jgi:hypothetical protein
MKYRNGVQANPLYSLIPLEDFLNFQFAAILGTDDREDALSRYCLITATFTTGWWTLWAFVTFADGRTAAGEAAKVYVWDEGAG